MTTPLRLAFIIDGDNTEAIAAVRRLEQEVIKAGGQVQAAGQKAAQGLGQIGQAAHQARDPVRLASSQLANLQYQLSDMAVGLTSGQSPFVVMMQQGSQVAQLFKPGTGIGGALKSVGEGIGSFLLNPLNLATVGFGLAATAAVGLFRALTDHADDAESVLTRHEELVKRVAAAYDEATGKAKTYGLESRALLLWDARRSQADTRTLLEGALGRFWSRDATGGMRMGGNSITAFGGTLWGRGGATMSQVEETQNRELINLVRAFGGSIEGFKRGQNDLDLKGFLERLADIQNRSADAQVKEIAQAIRDGMTDVLPLFQAWAKDRDMSLTLSGNNWAPTEALSKAAGRGLLDLIGYAEGTDKGRGYNETLGYGKFTGGPVDLVTMKMSEVLDLQKRMLADPANTAHSSAVGRYQITRQTLLDFMPKLGLTGDTLFSKEVQDRLALAIANSTGGNVDKLRGRWEGLKHVKDDTAITTAWDKSQGARAGVAQGMADESRKAAEAERDFALALKDRQAALKQSTTGLGFATEAQIRERRQAELTAQAHAKFGEMLSARTQGIIRDAAATEAHQEVMNRQTAQDQRWSDVMRDSKNAISEITAATGRSTLEMARARKEAELTAQAHAIYGEVLSKQVIADIKATAQAYGEQAAMAKLAAEQSRNAAEAERDQVKRMDDMRQTFGGLASSFFQAREQGESWGGSLSSVLDHLRGKVMSLLDTLIDNLLFGKQGTAGGGLLGGLLGGFTSLLSPPHTAPTLYATGGAFGPGVAAFAGGGTFGSGVVSRPTLFRFGQGRLGVMGEAGPEAIMPLVRGPQGLSILARGSRGEETLPLMRLPSGKLGVSAFADGDVFASGIAAARAGGGGSGGLVINNNITNRSSEPVTSKATRRSDGSVDIETMIGQAVNRHIGRGGADQALAGRFTGINRRMDRYG